MILQFDDSAIKALNKQKVQPLSIFIIATGLVHSKLNNKLELLGFNLMFFWLGTFGK